MARLTVEDLKNLKEKLSVDPERDKIHLLLCGGTGCHATGSIPVKEALEKEIADKELQDKVKVVETGCNGFCAAGPILGIYPQGVFYQKIKVDDIPEIVLIWTEFMQFLKIRDTMYFQ